MLGNQKLSFVKKDLDCSFKNIIIQLDLEDDFCGG
jgi:hypothetical protein